MSTKAEVDQRPADVASAGPGSIADQARIGFTAAISAYVLWGIFPIYYKPLSVMSADVVVAHRAIWSLVFVGVFLVMVGRFREVRTILADPKHVLLLMVSGLVILVNWSIFVWAIEVGRVLEVSFGYFCNPLVSVVLGVVILHEQLTRWQQVSLAIAAAAVLIQGVVLGAFPWIALCLAFSFATYGYLRKMIPVRATPGFFVETMITAPLALAYIAWVASAGRLVFPTHEPLLALLLIGTGAVTAAPLILFAMGARRLPLSTMGFLQYIAPSLHFVFAVFVFGEALSMLTLLTFVLIWVSLAIFTIDLVRRHGKAQAAP